MKFKRIWLFILFLCYVNTIFSQIDIDINVKECHLNKADTKILKTANKIYNTKEPDYYKKALILYIDIYNINIGYAPLEWRIAMCYLHTEDKAYAIKHLENCNASISAYYHFYLAKAYHYDGQFEKAQKHYLSFKKSLPESEQKKFLSSIDEKDNDFSTTIQYLIDCCNVGIESSNTFIEYTFENIKIINSEYNEVFPVFSPDGELIFSSNKPTSPSAIKTNYNIYTVSFNDEMNIISFPKLSKQYPNSSESSYIALNHKDENRELIYHSMGERNGDIMMVYTDKKNVISGKPIPNINSFSTEGLACFIDNNTLVFSSYKNNSNKKDLFISYRNNDNKWSSPVPISEKINSPNDEEIITFYKDYLYFSSNTKGGIGGFDIYKVVYLGNNKWGKIEHLDYPINTAGDDMGYYPIDEKSALYYGERTGGNGGLDIYKVTSTPKQ